MKLDDMFPSDFLKASDTNGTDMVLTIEVVSLEKVGQDREEKPVVRFKETVKGLILNKTNAKEIGALYGAETGGWCGKRITLYSARVQFKSEMVDALRVRNAVPRVDVPAYTPKDNEIPF